MLIYIKNIFSKINISEKTIPPNNKPKTSKNHIVPDYYINLGKQFYIKGWNNFNISQRHGYGPDGLSAVGGLFKRRILGNTKPS